ncbi:winged helix-turn-helix domain-containing protein [Poseidonibacter sp.]|uniref:winged helix-turn-helix domain-containing protein n=1 Tax=Poseidonibacter sp. TaxID=2321188 RepID=UPI003C76093D
MEGITLKIKITEEEQNVLLIKANKLDLTIEEYINKLIDLDVNSTVELNNGYIYNKHLNKLFDVNEREIPLTKTENKLLRLLVENINSLVTLETIHEIVWKGKNMSRFTLRNKVKDLRDKTFYELIKNHSNLGYSINS